MVELIRYTDHYKNQWDQLILSSRNGTFILYRDYLNYHSDKFKDLSFIILKKGRIEAVIAGNQSDSTFYTHQGLTYGGIISTANIVTTDILEIFQLLNIELKKYGIKKVVYKAIPSIYHTMPCQEDIYGLSINNAIKIACCISTTIFIGNKLPFKELRKRGINKSLREGVYIEESKDYQLFWDILQTNLSDKYNGKPTHSLNEIIYLNSTFPEHIKLYVAKLNRMIIAGVVLYVTSNVVHVQYIGANEQGKKFGALDLIFDELINRTYATCTYFDFGISTENMGNYLNNNLIYQKEGFGGRGIVYEIYSYDI